MKSKLLLILFALLLNSCRFQELFYPVLYNSEKKICKNIVYDIMTMDKYDSIYTKYKNVNLGVLRELTLDTWFTREFAKKKIRYKRHFEINEVIISKNSDESVFINIQLRDENNHKILSILFRLETSNILKLMSISWPASNLN